MSDKNQYQTLLRAKIESAINKARSASMLTHKGVKGNVLEILIGDLFKPLLPSDIGVGTGQIIDNYKSQMSNQIDIILYDKSILPPILWDEKTGLFPIESVLYTIEVKTKLNKTEIETAHESAKKISKFGYLPGLTDKYGNDINHPIERTRSVVFALNSDLKGDRLDEAQRYKKFYKDEYPYLRAICVAEKEYWYDDGKNWKGIKSNEKYDETLAFLGGVTNTYKEVSRSRNTPKLGNYIVPDITFSVSVQSIKVTKIIFQCESCGEKVLSRPNLGRINISISGTIIHSSFCPKCGGTIRSEHGMYKFVNGELIENEEK